MSIIESTGFGVDMELDHFLSVLQHSHSQANSNTTGSLMLPQQQTSSPSSSASPANVAAILGGISSMGLMGMDPSSIPKQPKFAQPPQAPSKLEEDPDEDISSHSDTPTGADQ